MRSSVDSDDSAVLAKTLLGKEIENVAEIRGIRAVDFRETAIRAGHRRKPFVLDVEDFCEHAARCAELVGIKVITAAFWTLPVLVLHRISASQSKSFISQYLR